jgi:lipopolysaccharide/colanic/teichoic acid biosynthesis glycosyltransferase
LADCERAVVSHDYLRLPIWKRSLDVCLALIALPCLLPIVAMIAVAIKLSSKGPVLFTQERVGIFGSRFLLYKFRTMRYGADTRVHEAHTAGLIAGDKPMTKLDAKDDRLISCGRVLRLTGLDELPQLINVLRGEMSIVGPRPCLPSEYCRYSAHDLERFYTPPGITGLWQVSGKNRTTFSEMIDLDIRYVQRRSLWLDLKIIMKTIPAIYSDVSANTAPGASRSSDQSANDLNPIIIPDSSEN